MARIIFAHTNDDDDGFSTRTKPRIGPNGAQQESRESKKLRDSNCTTLMLIVVITVFLAVELPLGIITILHIVSSTVYDFLDYEVRLKMHF